MSTNKPQYTLDLYHWEHFKSFTKWLNYVRDDLDYKTYKEAENIKRLMLIFATKRSP